MAEWQLELADEARLLFRGRPVAVRRRALALLALIALGFDPSRERLAAVLWEHGQALNNLRVELHGLRRYFPGWAMGADPLALPEGLEVRASARPWLANLRGITPALDAWIAALGERSEEGTIPLPSLRPPFVLFVRCLPLTDRERVLEQVAKATGRREPQRRVSLAVMHAGYDFDARTVLRRADRCWVVFLPPFGEDPADLLELRARLPAAQVGYLELKPLGWWEARERFLGELPFDEAARVYLAAGGQPGQLGELLALRPPGGFGARLPLPQRVSAVYRRESRYLSLEARMALERLSVHPGPLSGELLAALGLEEVVEELERKRWLVYRGAGWVFRHEPGRRVLAAGLEEGRRRLYHRRMAEVFDALGLPFAAAYHAEQAGFPRPLPQGVRGWARAVLAGGGRPLPALPTPRGGELLIEGFAVESGSVEVRGNRLAIVRTPGDDAPSAVVFETPELPTLLRVRGRARVENALGVGLEGDAYPLALEFGDTRMVLAPVEGPRALEDGAVLPIGAEFQHWVRLPPEARVRLESRAESAVIELELAFYRLAGPSGARVPAFRLDRAREPGLLGRKAT